MGVRSCDSVVAQLQRAKEETDEQVKAGIISGLRDQVQTGTKPPLILRESRLNGAVVALPIWWCL